MLTTVDLHDQPAVQTREVDDELLNRNLPAKVEAGLPAIFASVTKRAFLPASSADADFAQPMSPLAIAAFGSIRAGHSCRAELCRIMPMEAAVMQAKRLLPFQGEVASLATPEGVCLDVDEQARNEEDRKSTRLNSSH